MQPHTKRRDKWYEWHRIDNLSNPDEWRQIIMDAEKVLPCPLHMLYPEPGLVKDVIPYDPEPVKERFGTFFLTSTIAWMFADAIMELAPKGKMAPKGSEIAIYGVDMEHGTEYRDQRTGCRHMMQVAKHLGIKSVRRHDGGLAFDPIPYPFWVEDPMRAKLHQRIKLTKEQINAATDSRNIYREKYYETKGRLKEAADRQDADRCEMLSKELDKLEAEGDNIQRRVDHHQGMLDEQEYMLDYIKP